MSRRGINLKVVPHSEGEVRDRHLPYWLLILVGLIAIAIVTTLVILGIRFAQQAVDEQRLLTLRDRTADQQEQLMMFQEQINRLENEVASLDELVERLQEINPNVDLTNPDILDALEKEFESTLPLDAVREGGAAGRQAIGRLVERARHLAEGMANIEDNLEADPALVRFTPSLRPVDGDECYVTAGFGNRESEYTGRTYFHRGIAITAPLGTPVLTPADGTVVSAEHEGNFGLKLVIDHGGYYRTVYTHLQRVYVKPGEQVTRAQPIATVGNTGRTFGPKLHYEVIKGGRNLNPARFFLPDPQV